MAVDLPAALIEKLRGNNAVVTAFGENVSSPVTVKFHADVAQGGPSLPFAVYEENQATVTYMTQVGDQPPAAIEEGVIAFSIVAPGKKQARDLGKMIVSALNIDNTMYQIDDARVMNFRIVSQTFRPVADVAPDYPAAYHRLVVFEYMLQRTF